LPNTYINSNLIPHKTLPGAGEYAEILNNQLAGAENVVVTLRWLEFGEALDLGPEHDKHQLVYLMEGRGVITLEGKEHPVNKGSGVYLGYGESARIHQSGVGTLKLFHLVVPKQTQ
jgi:mannose-6-phosphate isomerase-like protein (cupin superfamily)